MSRYATGGPSATEVTDSARTSLSGTGLRAVGGGGQPLPDECAVGSLEGDEPVVRRVVDVEELTVPDRGAVEQAVVQPGAQVRIRWRVEGVVGLVAG